MSHCEQLHSESERADWLTAISSCTSCELVINQTHAHTQVASAKFCFAAAYRLHLPFVCATWVLLTSMHMLPFVESSVKKASFPLSRPSYLYIFHGQLAAPACVEAVLLNGGLVANWLLLQSGLWLCPWVIRGAVKREPLEHCQWTREGMPAQCRTTGESAARDVQIPERQRPCRHCRNLRVEKQERQERQKKKELGSSYLHITKFKKKLHKVLRQPGSQRDEEKDWDIK